MNAVNSNQYDEASDDDIPDDEISGEEMSASRFWYQNRSRKKNNCLIDYAIGKKKLQTKKIPHFQKLY